MCLLLPTWIKYHLVNYRYISILLLFISTHRYITWKYFVRIASCVVFNAAGSQRTVAPAFLVKAMKSTSSPPWSSKLSEKTVRLPTMTATAPWCELVLHCEYDLECRSALTVEWPSGETSTFQWWWGELGWHRVTSIWSSDVTSVSLCFPKGVLFWLPHPSAIVKRVLVHFLAMQTPKIIT